MSVVLTWDILDTHRLLEVPFQGLNLWPEMKPYFFPFTFICVNIVV